MFHCCGKFNQSLNWEPRKLESMLGMFLGCKCDIAEWDVPQITSIQIFDSNTFELWHLPNVKEIIYQASEIPEKCLSFLWTWIVPEYVSVKKAELKEQLLGLTNTVSIINLKHKFGNLELLNENTPRVQDIVKVYKYYDIKPDHKRIREAREIGGINEYLKDLVIERQARNYVQDIKKFYTSWYLQHIFQQNGIKLNQVMFKEYFTHIVMAIYTLPFVDQERRFGLDSKEQILDQIINHIDKKTAIVTFWKESVQKMHKSDVLNIFAEAAPSKLFDKNVLLYDLMPFILGT